jgi:DNA-binding transcriptional LysR family regulator
MSDRIQQLTVFIRAADGGSFSRAARELGLSQPSVSRIVSELEARLGVKLLLRTTRRVTPTEAGNVLLEQARQILVDLDDAENATRGVDSLRGTLRIAMSGAFGTREVIPHLPAFLGHHSHLRIDLVISDRNEDLVAEGVDIALRLGPLARTPVGFGVRLLGRAPRLAVVAPAYLARRGTPKTPAELSSHDCILGPGLSGRTGWRFAQAGALTSFPVEGRVRVATADGAIACAKAGLGIAVASRWMCRAELAAGQLVPILTDYQLESVALHALYPGGRRPSVKVRTFSDFLAAQLTPETAEGKTSNSTAAASRSTRRSSSSRRQRSA